ncbi:restriction endonuclease subunit S [uncultured Eubacterium sp.]|jgi:type I restriction enzyme S subunit|uniref:restriction endonuclease subunit S n=1 Tax=uncultured Eubacterium sp. TaxID=165185 RepID=UPI0032651C73
MGLTKYKLGKLIEQCDNRNSDEILIVDCVRGISTGKEFIETKANMDGVSIKSYKIVNEDEFAYVADTSRRGEKIAIAYNSNNKRILISSIYTAFYIKRKDLLLSDYLFMYFNRPEFDRYSRFNSWGSARETFVWEDMCDIELELPPLSIQQKYVDIYNVMFENQRNYERGLDDLKLVCDAYIEDLRKQMPCEAIGPYIQVVNESNVDNEVAHVQGVESSGSFMDTRANMQGVDISKYTIVNKGYIAYNPSRINIGSIAMYTNDEPCVVSPMYSVFKVIDIDKVLPEYLMLWFSRAEFQRYTWYYAAGSVRDTFDFNLMQQVEFPIPDIEIQQDIVNIFETYNTRRDINEKLKAQIKDICPILIKGSIEEAREAKEA